MFEKKNIKLIHGSAEEVLKTFPDCYFDAIITDPPYGIDFADYDGSSDVFFRLEDEFFRVLKKGGWLVFWWTVKKIPEIARFKKLTYRWMIVAEFHNTVSKCVLGDRTYAPIFVFSKGEGRVKMRFTDRILATELPQIQGVKIRQGDFKPTFTQAYLLSMFAGKEGRVLDPFAGFGSLLLASLLTKTGEVIGIEKDEKRFEVAKKLLEAEGIPASIPELLSGKEEVKAPLFSGTHVQPV